MEYKVSEAKLHELNMIVGNQGGVIPTQVSNALAAMQAAVAAGDTAEAKKQFYVAVEANQLNGFAWSNVQNWHDDVKRSGSDGTGTSPTDPGGVPGATIPPGVTECTPSAGVNGGSNLGTIKVNGGNYGAIVPTGDMWSYFTADRDGDVASMSCDGVKISFGVSDTPTDPGTPYNGNTAEFRPYKAGQFVCFRLGEGGYAPSRCALFSILKYA
jgi:hypothetical protein